MLNNLIDDIRTILSLRKDIREDQKSWVQYPEDFLKSTSDYNFPEEYQSFLINDSNEEMVAREELNFSVPELPSSIVYPDASSPSYDSFIDTIGNRIAIGAFKLEKLYKVDIGLLSLVPNPKPFWVCCYCLGLSKLNPQGDGYIDPEALWNEVSNTSQIPDVAGVWVKRVG